MIEIKKKVQELLRQKNIDVYFIDFMKYGELPYFVYTFDKTIIEEAKKYYAKGLLFEGCYDDFAYETYEKALVSEICQTIVMRYTDEVTENDT